MAGVTVMRQTPQDFTSTAKEQHRSPFAIQLVCSIRALSKLLMIKYVAIIVCMVVIVRTLSANKFQMTQEKRQGS